MSHFIRNSLYFEVVRALQSGESVVVSGQRLSGRSSLLRRLNAGVDGLRPSLVVSGFGRKVEPLEPIRLALIGWNYEVGPSRSSVLLALDRHLDEFDGPLVIDDAQRMDWETLTALERVAQRKERPLVVTTGMNNDRLHRGGFMLFADALHLFLSPVGMEDATALVAGVLEGAPENGTTAQILTKSGGIPGIIVALARDGRRSGALYEENGVWTSQRSNWMTGAKRSVLSLVDDLEPHEVDELTRLALLDRVDDDAAEKILDIEALAVLEQRGLLYREASRDDLGHMQVSVYPELLAEHLRNRTGLLQRRKLFSQLSASVPLATVDQGWSEPVPEAGPLGGGNAADAFLAATIQQDISTQLLVRREQWQRHRSLKDAIELLDLMVASGSSASEIGDVLAEAHDLPPRADAERASFAIWEARWRGWLGRDPAGAVALLGDIRARLSLESQSVCGCGLPARRSDEWTLAGARCDVAGEHGA